jgi:hypothetical protein
MALTLSYESGIGLSSQQPDYALREVPAGRLLDEIPDNGER